MTLAVDDLRVTFATPAGPLHAVDCVSLSLGPGRVLGVVGESGSGKSALALTIMGLTRAPGVEVSGSVRLEGRELLGLSEAQMRAVRGRDVAMVFQDPLSSLHPLMRVGRQIAEAIRVHGDVSRSAAAARAVELLDLAGVPDAARRARAHPHELSGGMRQRATIAMALANQPRVLIADEPTTALDVTVQAEILELLDRLRRELGMAIVLISHDLGVVARLADDVAVMYAGRVVERAPAGTLFAAPEHPYTWGLLSSMPRLDAPRERELVAIPGRPPNLVAPPSGCRFHPRCPHVRERHRQVDPPLAPAGGDPEHAVACLLDPETRRRLWRERAA